MGCGASTAQGQPIRVTERIQGLDGPLALSARPPPQQATGKHDEVDGTQINGNTNGIKEKKTTKKEANKLPPPAPKSVAFDVNLDNNGNNIDINEKKVPTRLKTKLAPLVNAPKLTADLLEEKLQLAEQNRLKELEKKKEVSRRSSRLRRNIVQARDFEKAQEQFREIEDKQLSAGKNRDTRLAALDEKKRAREERARRVKQRAKRLQQEGPDDLGFEIEKDEDFNAGDDDSWLGDDDRGDDFHADRGELLFSANKGPDIERVTSGTIRVTSGTEGRVPSGTERVYSGRESPSKRLLNPRSSDELRARLSAGTTDSFDYAFQRVPVGTSSQPVNDDFFDT